MAPVGDGVGYKQEFRNGGDAYTIVWSPSYGAKILHGAIREYFLGRANPMADVGYPTTDEVGTGDGVGVRQEFRNGGDANTMMWSPSTGPQLLHGGIRSRYLSMGGPGGGLGYPTTGEFMMADRVGVRQDFQNGSFVWSPSTGPVVVRGGNRQRWDASGGVRSRLGYPTADEAAVGDGVGVVQRFQNGNTYWSPATGVKVLYGELAAKFESLGGARVLGYPTDDTVAPDGVGRYTHLSTDGSIYWSPSTGAHLIYGGIKAKWAGMGWETSYLGYPTTDETAGQNGSRVTHFQRGNITWTDQAGAIDNPATITRRAVPNTSLPITGWVDVTVNARGEYTVSGHMHNSGGFDIGLSTGIMLVTRSGEAFSFGVRQGNTWGTFQGPFNWISPSDPRRDFDFSYSGQDARMGANWDKLVGAGAYAPFDGKFLVGDQIAEFVTKKALEFAIKEGGKALIGLIAL